MIGFGTGSKRFWRPLIGVVVAYAVAAQSLLIALGGLTLPVQANEGLPAFELCLHDQQGGTGSPADAPVHSGHTHCIFCFAGAQLAAIQPPPVQFHRIEKGVVAVAWAADRNALPRLAAHSIASPRGPPVPA